MTTTALTGQAITVDTVSGAITVVFTAGIMAGITEAIMAVMAAAGTPVIQSAMTGTQLHTEEGIGQAQCRPDGILQVAPVLQVRTGGMLTQQQVPLREERQRQLHQLRQ